MASKRLLLSAARLYVIVDAECCAGRDPVAVAEAAADGGADILQWRAKSWPADRRETVARALAAALAPRPVLFIINDHVELALAVGADGVHLGQDDLPAAAARPLMGPDRLIGVSTHSLEQALAAQQAGADYIGVGPVFATPTKPDARAVGPELVRQVAGRIAIPFVAIGGIDQANLPLVLSSGATRVAVVRAVAGAPDVRRAAQALKRLLTERTG
ncbi:MAG: thiamine-phosphate diphosphorylase [Omnitrophica WOR_2 bacterium RIFCSPHIGHO2_02_FULL_68_15]|nr:MAG: thiamine-phosphate diphosphorylase [Omnitrophica WOR_2 bacterium RIFCSPHIGHO2_02_FULL_68_15]